MIYYTQFCLFVGFSYIAIHERRRKWVPLDVQCVAQTWILWHFKETSTSFPNLCSRSSFSKSIVFFVLHFILAFLILSFEIPLMINLCFTIIKQLTQSFLQLFILALLLSLPHLEYFSMLVP